MRRRIAWHGALVLFAGLLCGFPILGAPHPRQWLTAHLSGMLAGIFLLAVAGVWNELRFGQAGERRTFILALGTGYAALSTGIAQALVGAPGPVTAPGPWPGPWQLAVVLAGFSLTAAGSLALCAALLYGLRRTA